MRKRQQSWHRYPAADTRCRAPTFRFGAEPLGPVAVLLCPLQPLQLIPQLLVVHQRLLLLLALLLHFTLQAVHLRLELHDIPLRLRDTIRHLGTDTSNDSALPSIPIQVPGCDLGKAAVKCIGKLSPRSLQPLCPCC